MKKLSFLFGLTSLVILTGCSGYKTPSITPTTTTETVPTTSGSTDAITTTPSGKQAPCPAMPTVSSCPASQEKYIIFSSVSCGKYYGCRPIIKAPVSTTNSDIISKKIVIANFQFFPATTEISVGSKITRTNNDSSPHVILADNGSFQSTTLQQGESFSFTFNKAGTYGYICSIHGSMKGTIIVK
ncbi:MAG: cupredoxin domain-containing protein [candidate division SR1 bacterium]|nr:cupredoxin domain-containing protein [candidate division SR1 bacterium]